MHFNSNLQLFIEYRLASGRGSIKGSLSVGLLGGRDGSIFGGSIHIKSKRNGRDFLATLVALDFTLVSRWLAGWVIVSN